MSISLPKPNRHARALVALLASFLAGCASSDSPRSQTPRTFAPPLASAARIAPGQLTPTEPRIDAVVGRPLIIPVRVNTPNVPAELSCRLDDGRLLRARLRHVVVEPQLAPTWLPGTGPWTISDSRASTPAPNAAALDILVVSMPIDAVGQGLWLADERLELHWLPFPQRLARGLKAKKLDLGPRAVKIGSEPQTRALLAPESLNPLRRWRARLATVGLEVPSEPGADQPASGDLLTDPLLEDWANLVQERWLIGLLRLRAVDSPLAEDLLEALTATAKAPAVGRIPVWPTDPADLDRLLSLLLVGDRPGPRELELIRLWTRERPTAAAWVIDDAGPTDLSTGAAVSSVGFLNLSPSRTLAWVQRDGRAAEADLKPIDPWSFARIDARPDPLPATKPSTPATLHLSSWARPEPIASLPIAVPDQGLRVGPLLPDWTLTSLLAGSPAPADAAHTTAALVFKDNDTSRSPSGWSIFIECAVPVSGEANPVSRDDRVLLFFGAASTASPAIECRPAAQSSSTSPAAPGRWTANVPIPSSAIDSQGVLRLGILRLDPLGRRSAFPRPLLPWDTAPGRVALRLRPSATSPGAAP